jgi:hypothetical protein
MVDAIGDDGDPLGARDAVIDELLFREMRYRQYLQVAPAEPRQQEAIPADEGGRIGLRRGIDLRVVDHRNASRRGERPDVRQRQDDIAPALARQRELFPDLAAAATRLMDRQTGDRRCGVAARCLDPHPVGKQPLQFVAAQTQLVQQGGRNALDAGRPGIKEPAVDEQPARSVGRYTVVAHHASLSCRRLPHGVSGCP